LFGVHLFLLGSTPVGRRRAGKGTPAIRFFNSSPSIVS
jgi:hypothetical protein